MSVAKPSPLPPSRSHRVLFPSFDIMAHAGAGAGPAAAAPVVAMNAAQLQQLALLMRGGSSKLQRMTEAPAAWLEHRRHFNQIITLNDWDDQRQRQEFIASIQGKAGNAISDLAWNTHPTMPLLTDAIALRFMPAAAGATARANYQRAKQLPMESTREWHTRVRELFNLAYPGQDPNAQPHALDLFVNGLYHSSVRFQVASQDIANFTAALPSAERAETASRDLPAAQRQAVGGGAAGADGGANSIAALAGLFGGMAVGNAAGSARGKVCSCFFCREAFNISAPHLKGDIPYFAAEKEAYGKANCSAGPTDNPGKSGQGRYKGKKSKRGKRAGEGVHALQGEGSATPAGQANASDSEAEN